MARIYKKNNSYYFSIEAGRDERTGKRQRIVRGGFRTKKEAQQASAELEVKFNTGNLVVKQINITLHEFMWEHWFRYHQYQVKISSVCSIKGAMRRIDKYINTDTKLKDVTTPMCNDFANERTEGIASPAFSSPLIIAALICEAICSYRGRLTLLLTTISK